MVGFAFRSGPLEDIRIGIQAEIGLASGLSGVLQRLAEMR